MAIVEVNGDTNAPGYVLRPIGTYDLRIDSAEIGQPTDPSKAPYLRCKGVITGVQEPQNRAEVGKEFSFLQSLSEKSATRVRKFLEQVDVDFQVGPDGMGLRFDTDHLIGKNVRGTCTHRVWNTKMQENWDNWEVARSAVVQGPPQGYAPPQAAPPQGYPPQGYAPPQAGQGYAPPPATPVGSNGGQR